MRIGRWAEAALIPLGVLVLLHHRSYFMSECILHAGGSRAKRFYESLS